MEWNTNENHPNNASGNHHNTIHNMSDFANINTNTYDLNQFNQLINLNNPSSHQDLIQSNDSIHLIHNRAIINSNGPDLLNNCQAEINVTHSRLENLTTSSGLGM